MCMCVLRPRTIGVCILGTVQPIELNCFIFFKQINTQGRLGLDLGKNTSKPFYEIFYFRKNAIFAPSSAEFKFWPRYFFIIVDKIYIVCFFNSNSIKKKVPKSQKFLFFKIFQKFYDLIINLKNTDFFRILTFKMNNWFFFLVFIDTIAQS